MYSNETTVGTPYKRGPEILLPMVEATIWAGFPSPATDHMVKTQDLNDLLVTHPAATFFWSVRGSSMVGAGIFDGDILVVNRALTPCNQDVVIAELDNDFTVKYLYKRNGKIELRAANPTFPSIILKEGQTLIICGVVTATIKRFRK